MGVTRRQVQWERSISQRDRDRDELLEADVGSPLILDPKQKAH
jgi:hypothetical protein